MWLLRQLQLLLLQLLQLPLLRLLLFRLLFRFFVPLPLYGVRRGGQYVGSRLAR
jgi:hypothetical protein